MIDPRLEKIVDKMVRNFATDIDVGPIEMNQVSYRHDWVTSDESSPSGKIIFVCRRCGIKDVSPVKEEYETRLCKRRRINESNSFS